MALRRPAALSVPTPARSISTVGWSCGLKPAAWLISRQVHSFATLGAAALLLFATVTTSWTAARSVEESPESLGCSRELMCRRRGGPAAWPLLTRGERPGAAPTPVRILGPVGRRRRCAALRPLLMRRGRLGEPPPVDFLEPLASHCHGRPAPAATDSCCARVKGVSASWRMLTASPDGAGCAGVSPLA
jgi:hypothetical protein